MSKSDWITLKTINMLDSTADKIINVLRGMTKLEKETYLVEEKYYYLRCKKKVKKEKGIIFVNQPFATICLICSDGKFYRGISFCSEKDQFCKKVGRKIASDRAYHALLADKPNPLPIRGSSVFPSYWFDEGLIGEIPEIERMILEQKVTKSQAGVQLTKFERDLFRLTSSSSRNESTRED